MFLGIPSAEVEGVNFRSVDLKIKGGSKWAYFGAVPTSVICAELVK